jgi:6-phosphogluconate dehydrogenase, C-terminal domain
MSTVTIPKALWNAGQVRQLLRVAAGTGDRCPTVSLMCFGRDMSPGRVLYQILLNATFSGFPNCRTYASPCQTDGGWVPCGLPYSFAKITTHDNPAVDGVVRWRLIDLAQWVYAAFRISISTQTLSQMLRAAQPEYGWELDLATIARIWRGRCIIRAQFLQKIMDAFTRDPDLVNLLLDPYFNAQLRQRQS